MFKGSLKSKFQFNTFNNIVGSKLLPFLLTWIPYAANDFYVLLNKKKMTNDTLGLAHTVTSSFCLFIIIWIEINIMQYNMISCSQINTQTASFGRQ